MKIRTLALILLAAPALFAADNGSTRDSHRAAARAFLDAFTPREVIKTNLEGGLGASITQMRAQGLPDAQIALLEEAVSELVSNLYEDPDLRAGMVDYVVDLYSEEELETLDKFFETDAGKKFAANMTEMNTAFGELGQQVVQKYMPAFQQKAQTILMSARGQQGGPPAQANPKPQAPVR